MFLRFGRFMHPRVPGFSQVRVATVDFMSAAVVLLRLLLLRLLLQTSTASYGWQYSPPDLNRDSEDMRDRAPERMSENMPEIMSADMLESMPERMSEDMPEVMSERVPEDMPESMSEGGKYTLLRWWRRPNPRDFLQKIARICLEFHSLPTRMHHGRPPLRHQTSLW